VAKQVKSAISTLERVGCEYAVICNVLTSNTIDHEASTDWFIVANGRKFHSVLSKLFFKRSYHVRGLVCEYTMSDAEVAEFKKIIKDYEITHRCQYGRVYEPKSREVNFRDFYINNLK